MIEEAFSSAAKAAGDRLFRENPWARGEERPGVNKGKRMQPIAPARVREYATAAYTQYLTSDTAISALGLQPPSRGGKVEATSSHHIQWVYHVVSAGSVHFRWIPSLALDSDAGIANLTGINWEIS